MGSGNPRRRLNGPHATMSDRLLNRELSWLDFNRRVLALAQEPGIPPLERLKFVAICSSNLDEFFQVRISALKDQVAAGVTSSFTGGLTPSQQLAAIGPSVEASSSSRRRCCSTSWCPSSPSSGVRSGRLGRPRATTTRCTSSTSSSSGSSRCSPRSPSTRRTRSPTSPTSPSASPRWSATPIPASDASPRVKVPTVFPRLVGLPDGVRFLPAEQLIAAQLHSLFVGMVVEEHAVFRVTRNVDLTLEDEEADDLLAAVEMELRRRRFGRAVRVEVQAGISEEMLELLAARARSRPRRRHRPPGPARPHLPVAAARARSCRPQGPAVAAGHRRPDRRRRGSRPQHLLGHS